MPNHRLPAISASVVRADQHPLLTEASLQVNTRTGGVMRKCILAVLCFSLSLGWSSAARADAVTVWNANAGVAATAACIAPLDNPLHESRIYAMMHVAIHDALIAIDRRSRPYAFDMQAEPGLLRTQQLLRRHEMCLTRSSVNSLSSFTPNPASMQALQVSKPTIRQRSARSPMGKPRRRVLRWDRPLPQRSSP